MAGDPETLLTPGRAEVLQKIACSMQFSRAGKATNVARDMAIDILAEMVLGPLWDIEPLLRSRRFMTFSLPQCGRGSKLRAEIKELEPES
jgi:hypothetical protein